MKTFLGKKANLFAVFCLLVFQANLAFSKEINKTFKGVSEIKIQIVSGDCFIQKSSNNELKVSVSYTFDERDFEADFNQIGKRLNVSENFYGRNNHGKSVWKIWVPSNVDVDFSSASGDLALTDVSGNVEGQTASGDMSVANVSGDVRFQAASGDIEATDIKGDVKINTASGDIMLEKVGRETEANVASGEITIKNSKGAFELSAASGNIEIESATGVFEISTASGDISCDALEITDGSEFEAASGDVAVSLAKSPVADISLSAASGDCKLDYGDNKILGYIRVSAKNRNGYVKAPFKFDNEKVYEKWGREFVTKTAKRGDGPAVELNSASGRVTLAQN